MSGEVIKSFMVGLGFNIDEGDLAKFNKAINNAGVKIAALYTSINLLAGGIVKSISSISEGFEQMGYEYHLIAPAINKALVLRREMLKAYSAAGINIQKVVANSVKLNFSLAKTKFALEAIYKSVGSKFFTLLTRQSDIFRNNLYKFMPKIQAGLEKFVNVIFKAFDAVTTLGLRLWSILTRVYDFFVQLDKATDGWSTFVLGLVAAWKLLNLSFLATPLGMVLAGLLAILALYDDFKTFEEGGKSLFNWTDAVPTIHAVEDAVKALMDSIGPLFKTLFDLGKLVVQIFTVNTWENFFSNLSKLFSDLNNFVNHLYESITKFFGVVSAGASWINKLLGNADVNPQMGQGLQLSNPVGSNVANSQVNQNVKQQTNINVTGGADANAIGQAVGGQQARVNQDMVRNMKGATR